MQTRCNTQGGKLTHRSIWVCVRWRLKWPQNLHSSGFHKLNCFRGKTISNNNAMTFLREVKYVAFCIKSLIHVCFDIYTSVSIFHNDNGERGKNEKARNE